MRRNNQINIDIVTPTLNAEKYLIHCLLGCAEINNITVKHYIVDSHSVDRTIGIANKFENKILTCVKGNMYRAINVGVTAGNSEWITYINSDDILFPNAFSTAIIENHEKYDIIYGNIDYIDNEGRFLHHWKSAEISSFAGLFASNIMPFPQQGTLFRRSLWEKLGGFREQFKYSADFDFFLRAFVSGARFGYFSVVPTAAFRLHGDQISQNFASTMYSEGRQSFADTGLSISQYEKLRCKLHMRIRNLNSYIVRLLRSSHLQRKTGIVKSIQ
jgi:glycosyltransferase involved in cell wall biosynthesis